MSLASMLRNLFPHLHLHHSVTMAQLIAVYVAHSANLLLHKRKWTKLAEMKQLILLLYLHGKFSRSFLSFLRSSIFSGSNGSPMSPWLLVSSSESSSEERFLFRLFCLFVYCRLRCPFTLAPWPFDFGVVLAIALMIAAWSESPPLRSSVAVNTWVSLSTCISSIFIRSTLGSSLSALAPLIRLKLLNRLPDSSESSEDRFFCELFLLSLFNFLLLCWESFWYFELWLLDEEALLFRTEGDEVRLLGITNFWLSHSSGILAYLNSNCS